MDDDSTRKGLVSLETAHLLFINLKKPCYVALREARVFIYSGGIDDWHFLKHIYLQFAIAEPDRSPA